MLGFFIFFLFNEATHLNAAHAAVLPDAEESHPGLGMESRYAEAVIAYNRKQTDTALGILDELIEKAPKTIEYLELKALILKGLNQPDKSLKVYWQLYQVSPDQARGPYAFEVATLLDKAGRHAEARKFFYKAISLKFNVAASHLYLGIGSYNAGNYIDAEQSFNIVANSGIQDLELIGRYYLGLTYFKLNNGAQGISEIIEVQKMSRQREGDDLSKSIGASADKMLLPFSKGQWFGNAALMSQYDSNIQQLPTGISNPASGVNPATLKVNFSGGGGYMTAPLNTIQWVAGYRATANYNFNSQTRAFQYFTNTASLFMNYRTLARTSAGLKVEGNYTFQDALNNSSDTTSGYTYQKYSSSITIGPYFKHQLNRAWRLDADVGYRKQTYYIDPSFSGNNVNIRVSVRNDNMNLFWNPGFSLVYEINNAEGANFAYKAYGLGITNSMNLRNRWIVTQSIDFLSSNYQTSDPKRDDKNFAFKIGASKPLGPKWTLIGDIGYIKNTSTVEASYSYNRFITSAGVGYTF